MRTVLTVTVSGPTAVRQAAGNLYTKMKLPSSPRKLDHTAGNFSIPPEELFSVSAPTAQLLAACRWAVGADRHSPPSTLFRPESPSSEMLRRLLRDLPDQAWLLLPAASLLAFAVLAGLYRPYIALLETPDEPSHFSVANYVAQHHTLPPFSAAVRTGPAPTVSPDVPYYYAPPLYYLLAALLVGAGDTAEFAQAVIPNPNFARGIGVNLANSPDNKNMYVHTAAQNPRHLADWARAMWRVRLLSLALGLVTVAGSYALARQIWPTNRRWRVTAVALIVFNPTFLYLSNGVTNDTLLIALCTWSFVLLGQLLAKDDPAVGWREPVLAFLIGAAVLTKQTGFILLPPALLVLWTRAQRQQWSWTKLLLVLLGGVVVVTAVGGWWYLCSGLLYGDALALATHNALPPVENIAERLQFSLGQSWGAFRSYWAAFGWATIFVEPAWYLFFAGLTLVGLVGWLRPRPRLPRMQSLKLPHVLWLAVLLNGGLMLIWLWRTAAPYGRLLFPVIAPLSCLLVLGWQRWGGRVVETAVPLMLVLPLAGLALLAPRRFLQPAFAPVAQTAVAASLVPVNATFGGQYELLGYTLEPATAQAGERVTVTLYWQLSQPEAAASTPVVFLHVAPLDPEARVAEASDLLGTPRYPAEFWQPGEVMVQPHRLVLPADMPVPSLYWFDLILFDEARQVRLPVTWQGQALAEDAVRLGPTAVLGRDTAAATPSQRAHYNFSQQIRLNGYSLAVDGAGLDVTLFWEALAPPTVDWTVFVHLLDASGQLLAQGDGVPRSGSFPTSWWPAGTIVPDRHHLPGEFSCADLRQFTLLVGFYNPTTAERLPVHDDAGKPLPNHAVALQLVCEDGRTQE
jgi:4-amino-4-deoxy-L-arabinose transferase-like glycosyltransferase